MTFLQNLFAIVLCLSFDVHQNTCCELELLLGQHVGTCLCMAEKPGKEGWVVVS